MYLNSLKIGTGIVNCLSPALLKTTMNVNIAPEQLAYMSAKIPMGRLGPLEEVASIGSWIVCKDASFNTEVIFDISGRRAIY